MDEVTTVSPDLQASLLCEDVRQEVNGMQTLVGIIIAAVVLLPEGLAAVRAARANRLQTSLNLALGSALASIGLTIPAVAFTSMLIGVPLILGLDSKDLVFLLLTSCVALITFVSGRGHVMMGAVHLVICGAFLFLAAFSVAAVALSPFAAAAAVRLNLAG